MKSGDQRSSSLAFDVLGNRYPSTAERLILLDVIERDQKRLRMVENDIEASEEQLKAAYDSFETTKLFLDDADLRLRVITSLKFSTSMALDSLNATNIEENHEVRLGNATSTGVSHLAVTNRVLKQHDKPLKVLRDRILALETAQRKAEVAVTGETESHHISQVRLLSLQEDVRMYKEQAYIFLASIQEKKRHLSVIRKLSTEIWLQIFQVLSSSPCQPDSQAPSKLPVLNPALALSHVCKSWASVMLNNPPLWGSFYLQSLVLDPPSLKYLNFCLSRAGHRIFVLHVQTWASTTAQARVLTDLLQSFSLHKLHINVESESVKAATHLIQRLPSPEHLSICGPDNQENQKNNTPVLDAQVRHPEKLQSLFLRNSVLRSGPTKAYNDLSELVITLDRPAALTDYLFRQFSNVKSVLIGANPTMYKSPDEGRFIFPRLQKLTGPLAGLLATFGTRCGLPALLHIGFWLEGDGNHSLELWKQFIRRERLHGRFHSVEIYDMEPVDAFLIADYVLQLMSISRLVVRGRSVDEFLRKMASSSLNPPQRNILSLHTLVIQNYNGDGQSISSMVESYNQHWRSSSNAAAPQGPLLWHGIKEVSLINCRNVAPRIRKEITQNLQRDLRQNPLDGLGGKEES